MPYRRIPIMIIVVALVGALLTTLMPLAYAAPKERSHGRPVSRGEQISSAEERTNPKERTSSEKRSAGVQAEAIPGQYIITLKRGADPTAKARGLARALGLDVLHVYEHALNGFAARVPDGRLARLQADPDVVSIDEDLKVVAFAQTLPTGIDRADGELSSTESGDGSGDVDVDVAVLDTGIDLNHPDLNVVGGKNCINDGPSYDDGNGHGTHVAGTIGAKDDNEGVVGVAPGARLWAVRVLNDDGNGSSSSIICGINFVTANAGTIEVANMSLGGPARQKDHERCGKSTALHNAICNSVKAGITYAVAAGNESANANNTVPATYNQVITVSALADFDGEPGGNGVSTCSEDKDDTFANFSNYGKDVDLIAPGVCILSTWRGGSTNTVSGTSMASPHVAGAAALYKANNPAASPGEVKMALKGAGGTDWNNSDDRDSTKEKLLNVKTF